MKLNDMHHLNTKFLCSIEKSNLENKILKKQLGLLLSSSHCVKCSHGKVPSQIIQDSSDSTVRSPHPPALRGTKSDNSNAQKYENESRLHVEHKSSLHGTKPKNVKIVGDSITKLLALEELSVAVGAVDVAKAPTVNEAVDFVQEHAENTTLNIIHSGTNNIPKDTANVIIKRIKRLETNIKAKKLKHIALSSIVHRRDDQYRGRTVLVNKAIKNIRLRNQWFYNNNIDSSCLWSDGLHLNHQGKERLMSNIMNTISPFLKSKFLREP